MALLFYAGMDEGGEGVLEPQFGDPSDENFMTSLKGQTESLGKFRVKFVDKGEVKGHFSTLVSRYERFG